MLSWKSNHREGVSGQARLCPTFIHNNRCQARTGCRHSRSLRWTELASGHMEGSPYSRFPPPSPPPVARIRPPLRPVLLFEGEEKYYFGDSTNCFSSLCSAWSLGHKGWESAIASVQRSPTPPHQHQLMLPSLLLHSHHTFSAATCFHDGSSQGSWARLQGSSPSHACASHVNLC